MKTSFKINLFIFTLTVMGLSLNAQDIPNDLKNMMQFIGNWEAPNTVMNMGGKDYRFTYYTDFEKTAGGSGLLMHEWADVPDLGKFDGENLIGYDPAGKKLLWYSVNNMGTTHEHEVQWKSDTEMHMEHNSTQEGKPYKEQITAIFKDPNTIDLSIVETLDGNVQSTIKAVFRKKM
jgi:hypothetical protein